MELKEGKLLVLYVSGRSPKKRHFKTELIRKPQEVKLKN
jgi:hypothetical protein